MAGGEALRIDCLPSDVPRRSGSGFAINMPDTQKNLGSKLLVQIGGNSTLQLVSIALDLVLIALLARLLTPSDYGIFAVSLLFLAFCDLIRDAGIGSTLIQLPKLSMEDQQTALTLVMLIALLMFAAIQALAPLYADFMRKPEAVDVLRVMAIGIPIQSLASISQALLLRDLRANQVMRVEIGAKLFGNLIVGACLALLGFGYWALAAASLADASIRCLTMTVVARPPLRPRLDRASLSRITRVGSGFAVSRFINFIALRGDDTVVGRYMDAASLGLYTRAYKLMSLPADLYMKIADRIVFPAFASVQTDTERLRRAFMRGAELTALIGIPMTVLLFLLAPEIVGVLLGANWEGVVPVFSALAAATYFRLSGRASGALLRATAAIGPMIRIQIVYAVCVVGGALAAIPYGLVAVGATVSCAVLVWYVLTTIAACRIAQVRIPDIVSMHRHGLYVGVLVAVPTALVVVEARALDAPDIVVLAAAGLTVGAIGVGLLLLNPASVLGGEGARLVASLRTGLSALARRSVPPSA